MPKYNPTPEDMFVLKPCFICGRDVIDDNTDTCSWMCEQAKISFEEDLEWMLCQQYLK